MAKWVLLRKGADYDGLSKRFGIDPLILRLLVNRGVDTEDKIDDYINGGAESFKNPHIMKDMDKAADIIRDKINLGKRIRVIGDYDGDGVCSTAILLKGLKVLGANVDGVIPHRVKDGYGLNISMVEDAYRDGIDTILTCDNGISAKEQVDLAKEYGMTVVITDHHEVPFEEEAGNKKYILPKADAVVDPKQEDCPYGGDNICGAFVAYKLMEVMLGDTNEKLLLELLQLAAIATITDIMALRGENRALVREGLKLMPQTSIIGLASLIKVLGLYDMEINSFHIGFMIGPCINAAGRIGSADKALELLMSENASEAMSLAGELKDMNESRKLLTDEGALAAQQLIETSDIKNDKVFVIYLPDCHESVVGIIAGRIKERYYRPALVMTKNEEGLKGSARSIEAYNMYAEMCKISEVFDKFGGHPQAAGFSLAFDRLDELRRRLNDNCSLTENDLTPKYVIDADPPFSYFNGNIVDSLNILEPFGNGNEKPLFARSNLKLVGAKTFGAEGKVGRYTIIDTNGVKSELTMFRRNAEFREYLKEKYGEDLVNDAFANKGHDITISVIFYPKWNEYQGRRTIQFIIEDYC